MKKNTVPAERRTTGVKAPVTGVYCKIAHGNEKKAMRKNRARRRGKMCLQSAVKQAYKLLVLLAIQLCCW